MTLLLVLAFLLGCGLLGGLCGVFVIVPYWGAERRGRARWRKPLPAPPSQHPYRAARIDAPSRHTPPRAPALVRAAAMTSFLWAWACLAWAIVVVLDRRAAGQPAAAAVVFLPLAAAFLVQRAGRRLLARDEGTLALVRPLAIVQAIQATALIALGIAAEWAGTEPVVPELTVALGIGAAIDAALVRAAASGHRAAFFCAKKTSTMSLSRP